MTFALTLKRTIAVLLVFGGALAGCAQASAPQTISKPSAQADRWFAFGKSMFVRNEHGSQIPYDVIDSDIQGWGRFTILNSSEKADLIAEVTSYESGAVTVGGNTDYLTPDGKPRPSTQARKDLNAASVMLKVYDGRTRRELWSGTERVKSAFKKKSEEDNIVAAAEKLFRRFHDSVEPPAN